MVQDLATEQKKEFDSQMELEKGKYENKLQEALEEEKVKCRKTMEETLELERLEMNKKVEEEKEKLREDLQEERKKYLEEMKSALSEEKEKNRRDKVVRHRQLSGLDIFLETAKQQLNVLMEDNQKDVYESKLDNEKKDET